MITLALVGALFYGALAGLVVGGTLMIMMEGKDR